MEIQDIFSGFDQNRLFWDEPMRRHTSFRVGGNADLMLVPSNKTEIVDAVSLLKRENIPFFVMGNGSNLIVRDRGYRGVIIKISKEMGKVSVAGDRITSEAGALLSQLASAAMEASLAGLEFASGIPGSVGGAVCMNAGAYGSEIKDCLTWAQVILDGEICRLSNAELDLAYRSSRIQKDGLIVLEAEFSLKPGDKQDIKDKTDDFNKRRREKQPLDMPSAGSTFKRPKDGYAGQMIMECGLSGFSIGGAQVSPKHCGFVVNSGGASAADIIELMEHVTDVVRGITGITLEPEVKIIGE